MEVKKLADSLDDNLFSDKNFKKAYVVYAFWMILSPILAILTACLGLDLPYYSHMMLASVLFMVTKVMEWVFNFRNIKFKKIDLIQLLMLVLCFWFVLTSLIVGAINVNFVIGFCYFIFLLFFAMLIKNGITNLL